VDVGHRVLDGCVANRGGHEVGGGAPRDDLLGKGAKDLLPDLEDRGVPYVGRRSVVVPAAAELPHQRPDVHLGLAAASDQHDAVPHMADGEQDVHRLHVAQFVDEDGQVPHVLLPAGLGDDHLHPVDGVRLRPLDEVIQ
jgi:hypothetical protein